MPELRGPVKDRNLYDVAKRITLEHGMPWTDPRTGRTYKPKKGWEKRLANRRLSSMKLGISQQDLTLKMAEELAAKVRGYFTNPATGRVNIPESMDGDRDLYDLASRITKRVVQPGGK